MVHLTLNIQLCYVVGKLGVDFVFNIHAANTENQKILNENLDITPSNTIKIHVDRTTNNRYMRIHAAAGNLKVSYQATIQLEHHFAEPNTIHEVPICNLPPQVMCYLYPSRYCQSDRLGRFSSQTFSAIPSGYGRALAIQNWVKEHIDFHPNSSNSNTSALDTLVSRNGVCRDFAHLMIALCRAINLPARFVSGTDYGASSSLGPPDFHAYVEVYLGNRWYIFDPSGTSVPMGLVRLGTGRDAADVSVATIFGGVKIKRPLIDTKALIDIQAGWVLPVHCHQALSTARWFATTHSHVD